MGRTRVGLSGWDYDQWKGDFYPDDLPKRRRLAYAAERVDTIEVNATFYGLVAPSTFRSWRDQVPRSFRFAIKGSRFITHTKRLRDPAPALANFFASGVLELGERLGPVLWQLPPDMRFDAERVDRFLSLLPHDTEAARSLARHHDDRVDDVALGPDARHRVRHVLEVRHQSFLCDDLVRAARRQGVALASSHASAWPYLEEVTAGFVYVRLHGPDEPYASPYGERALRGWADRVRRWHEGAQPDDAVRVTGRRPPRRKERDVYVYFDNDDGGHAPREAARLRELLGLA